MEACKNAARQSRHSIAVYMGRRPCLVEGARAVVTLPHVQREVVAVAAHSLLPHGLHQCSAYALALTGTVNAKVVEVEGAHRAEHAACLGVLLLANGIACYGHSGHIGHKHPVHRVVYQSQQFGRVIFLPDAEKVGPRLVLEWDEKQ